MICPPVHELAVVLPPGARLFGDKAWNSAADATSMRADTGVRRIPVRREHMQPHAWFVDDIALGDYRHTIETVSVKTWAWNACTHARILASS